MDILDANNLLSICTDIVSQSADQGDDAVLLAQPHEALAALSHTIMCVTGFNLKGLGENTSGTNEHLENRPHERELDEEFSGIPHRNDLTEQDENLNMPSDVQNFPATWRTNLTFRYTHSQSSMTFLLKVLRMASRTVFIGMAIENEKTVQFEVATADYTSSSFFPFKRSSSGEIAHAFISNARVNDFSKLFKIKILQKLIPGLQKAGYEESLEIETPRTNVATSSTERERDPRYIPHDPDPLRIGPIRGGPSIRPPYFEDDPDNERFYSGGPIRSPFSIGRDDLDPLGSNPIMGPPRFGGSGSGSGRGLGDLSRPGWGGNGNGMYMDPHHPLFSGEGNYPISGDDRFLPPGSVPPGARFDPIMPNPNQGPGPLPGVGRGRGSNLPNRSGEPDPDHERPPGNFDTMFM